MGFGKEDRGKKVPMIYIYRERESERDRDRELYLKEIVYINYILKLYSIV